MPDTKSTLMKLLTNVKVVGGALLTVTSIIFAIWAFDDRYAKITQLQGAESRIVSEVRSESAETRVTLIEDMESRLDEFDYDISILESSGEAVPESLRIKRNMLNRRIQRLKDNNENINHTNSN